MNYMLMVVFEDTGKLDALLEALCAIGVGGATIIESSGLHRRRAKKAHIPLRFNFEQLGPLLERSNYTLFTLVEESLVEASIAAIEKVLGDLNRPNSGVLAAWPVPLVRGLSKQTTHTTCADQEVE